MSANILSEIVLTFEADTDKNICMEHMSYSVVVLLVAMWAYVIVKLFLSGMRVKY